MVLVRLSLLLLATSAALVGAALVAPVRLKLRWFADGAPSGFALVLTLLWGLGRFRLVRLGRRRRATVLLVGRRVAWRRRRRPTPPSRHPRRARAPLSPGRVAGGEGAAWWRERELVLRWLRRLPALLDRLARTARFEPVALRLRFGLGDPAETGIVYGAFWALLGPALSRIPFRDLSVEGDWLNATFASSGRLCVWARPGAPLLAMACFVLGGPWLRTLRAVRAAKKANLQHGGKGRKAGDTE